MSAAPSPGIDLRTRIAQMLLVGFRGLDLEQAAPTLRDISDRGLGGVVLFDFDTPTRTPVRNIESPEQLAALVQGLQDAARSAETGLPLLVAIDQEGGRVARLGPTRGFSPTESAAALGRRGDPAHTQRAAAALGATLAAAGINFNLAPVVDLDVNPSNPIIGALNRSFSADPAVVIAQAEAFVRGQHQTGVACAIKHFPGHGSSTGDTHLGVVDVTDTWTDVELEPFAALAGGGLAEAVLTAHVFNARLDRDHPATLSHPTITGILRERLGWDGVVISDDLQMGAIRHAYGYEDAVRLAIEAGIDVLTIANQQIYEEGIVDRTIDVVAGLVDSGRLSEARIDESWRRIGTLKEGLAG